MAGNNGGPWGGGGNNGSGNNGNGNGDDRNRPGRRPGQDSPQIPEIDDLVNKGREQLRVLMGGGGGSNNGAGGSGGGGGPAITRGTVGLGILALIGLWLFASFYTVRPEEKSVELLFGSDVLPSLPARELARRLYRRNVGVVRFERGKSLLTCIAI